VRFGQINGWCRAWTRSRSPPPASIHGPLAGLGAIGGLGRCPSDIPKAGGDDGDLSLDAGSSTASRGAHHHCIGQPQGIGVQIRRCFAQPESCHSQIPRTNRQRLCGRSSGRCRFFDSADQLRARVQRVAFGPSSKRIDIIALPPGVNRLTLVPDTRPESGPASCGGCNSVPRTCRRHRFSTKCVLRAPVSFSITRQACPESAARRV